MQLTRLVIFAMLSVMLLGCTSDEQRLAKELESFHGHVASQIQQLKTHINAGRVRNIALLKSYADVLSVQKPELKPIIKALAKDATLEGPIFTSLVSRLHDAKVQIPVAAKSPATARALIDEFNAINTAAKSDYFNMALSDPINVLADMSEGKLASVNSDAGQVSSHTQASGNQLVGNPNYGQWQTDNSGTSFWAWYGQYAFFSSLFSQPVRYADWSRNRRPSYYNDYGYNAYSSPKQKQQYQETEQKVRKKFASEGKKFQSPYAKKTTTNTGLSNTPKVSAPGKFKSAYASKSTHQSGSNNKPYQSSFAKANNSTYTSRTKNTSGSRSYGSGGK